MNRLTIRVKMMLWYTLLTGVLLAVFIPTLYRAISQSLFKNEEGVLRTAMSQVISDMEVENNTVVFDGQMELLPGIYVVITDSNGTAIYSNNSLNWIADESYVYGEVRKLQKAEAEWLFYDELIENDEKMIASIHLCSSYDHIESSLNNLKLILLFSSLAFLAIAILGGLFIAGRALSPISDITKTAAKMESGDLTNRISGIHSKDEVGLLADTFNKMLERLEVSFTKEKQFASDASHELRTPVAIIMAHAEEIINKLSMVDENINFSFDEYAEIILSESKRMNVIISQLLMLTRGYEGKYPLELETFDLTVVMEEVTHQMEKVATLQNISLLCEADSTVEITADQSLVTQLLINLIENAIKYNNPEGYVKISALKGQGNIRITVEDNGMGIARNDIAHIFDRFYRVDTSRDRSGTGLGLSIVKWIVDEHNGEIIVASELGKGTKFDVLLKNQSGISRR